MKYVNQAPKDFDAQSAKFKKRYHNVEALLDAGWEVQPKYDGVFCMIDTSELKALSRQGKEMPSVGHLLGQCREGFGPDKVVFMEVYKFGTLHKDINGASRRQYLQDDLIGVVFDVVPKAAFEHGFYPRPYIARLDDVYRGVQFQDKLIAIAECPTLGRNGTVQGLAEEMVSHPTDAYDGVILRDPAAPWNAGACKEGEAIKVKAVLSLDLEITNESVTIRPTKLGGQFTVNYKGVPSDVGSGLTQDMMEKIKAGFDNQTGPVFVGSIAEVECLGLTPDGKLREPRLKAIRHDAVREEDK